MGTVSNINDLPRACKSVRAHCAKLQLTGEQTESCVSLVIERMGNNGSSAAAIGDAKQRAERYARPAMRRNSHCNPFPSPPAAA